MPCSPMIATADFMCCPTVAGELYGIAGSEIVA